MVYTFEDCRLDEELYVLCHAGQPLKLEPKVLGLLVYLLHHRQRVVPKNELIEQLWPAQVVTEAALTHCMTKARKAMQDDGGSQRVIKTLHGRGYRFVAEVTEEPHEQGVERPRQDSSARFTFLLTGGRLWQRGRLAGVGVLLVLGWSLALWQFFFNPFPPAQALLSRHKPALALPHKPSLAVLPFATQDEGPQQRAFSSGLTEGLITSLSRVSGLFVAARNAPVLYQARDITPEQVGRELGVRYVLEGSVRRADDQVRITAQLVDTATGYQVWAQRYDRPFHDIFALQDEITDKIVSALAVKLKEEERSRMVLRYTDNVEAYDFSARGWDYFGRYTQAANLEARQLFAHALDLDPRYTVAYVVGASLFLAWIGPCGRVGGIVVSAFPPA